MTIYRKVMNKMTTEEVRNIVRETLMGSDDINEYDALHPKKQEWNAESKELRTHLVDLLKNIQDDEYEAGLNKIDNVIEKLKNWKSKIQKFI